MKLHLTILCTIAAAILTSAASIPEGSVSSTNASYDGNALVLSGHVVLDHTLGKMTADEASLQKQEVGKDFPFAQIQLRKDVHLALKNSAEVLCGAADLDFTVLKGYLLAKEAGKVIYSDLLKRKKENVPLKLMGDAIELTFLKEGEDERKLTYEIETIQAKSDVVIEYANAFVLYADHALYRRFLGANTTKAKEFQGIITAYPKDTESKCQLKHGEDLIDADVIDFDLIRSKASLLNPQGVLTSPLLPHLSQGQTKFKAQHLAWDHLKNILTLSGKVVVDDASLGTIQAHDEIQIEHAELNGKTVIKTIHTRGPATLVYQDPLAQKPHKLVSHGTIHIDRDRLNAQLESPMVDGVVSQGKQLYYEEQELGVFADHATLEFSIGEKTLEPVSLTLKGHIRLFSHNANEPPRAGIADRLHYSLSTRTLILAANPGNQVLFWDESQGLRMAAPEVHIVFDPESNQRTVKGVGKVQFAFSEEENQRLKQLFPHYKIL